MYEQIYKIKFRGAAFTDETTLQFYDDDKQRMSIVYGRNGSGKSTIARAFEKVNGNEDTDIISASLLDLSGNDVTLEENNKSRIYVFDDDYIQKNVMLKEDGLNTIVMFGKQALLESNLVAAENELKQIKSEYIRQEKLCNEYSSKTSVLSPAFFISKIESELSGDDHWSGRQREITGQRRNSSVNKKIIETIMKTKPILPEDVVISEYDKYIAVLRESRTSNAKIIETVPTDIGILPNEIMLLKLLSIKIEKPELSEREEYLLSLLQSERLLEIQNTFSDDSVEQCPYCLQDISRNYKESLLNSIKKILSREVEIYKKKLSNFKLTQISINLDPFVKLPECLRLRVSNALNKLNDAIDKNNIQIQKKLDNPFDKFPVKSYNVESKMKRLSLELSLLEEARTEYNKQFDEIEKLQKKLLIYNSNRAYYEIYPLYNKYLQQCYEKAKQDELLHELEDKVNAMQELVDNLIQEKRDVKIAADIINSNLQYVFLAKNRLSIKAENGIYSLLSNGKAVKPRDVSVGERNVIALCYFFANMLLNREVDKGYSEEMFVVIDDPISSFDFENKIGIMSFLKARISQIMRDNLNTKLLVLTHDLPSVLDFQKSFEEIKKMVKSVSGKDCNYCLNELDNKRLKTFSYRNRNEYTELLKTVFEYAKSGIADYELIIGNTMRRVLETFSTFVYRKGIEEISRDEDILNDLGSSEYKSYFGNLMYRLVLNGESHMRDRTKTLIDSQFTSFISPSEKQRIAQDIVCFMYLLNPTHINSHLKDISNSEQDIKNWCSRIQQFNV